MPQFSDVSGAFYQTLYHKTQDAVQSIQVAPCSLSVICIRTDRQCLSSTEQTGNFAMLCKKHRHSPSYSPGRGLLLQMVALRVSTRLTWIDALTIPDSSHSIRTRSPFLEFTPEQVTKLCKCVAATPSKPKREATVPLLEKRQTKASCSAEVSIRFTQPWRFCNFYSA